MPKIKIQPVKFEISGRTYGLSCNLCVIEALQDRYGTIDKALKATQNAKDMAVIAKAFLDNAVDRHNEDFPGDPWEELSLEEIKKRVNFYAIGNALSVAFQLSMPDPDDTEPEKNGKPGNKHNKVVRGSSFVARLFAKRSTEDNNQGN